MRIRPRTGQARLAWAVVMLVSPSTAAAQQVGPTGFQSMPADERWTDPGLAGVSARLKGVSVAPDVSVDLGGSLKERVEAFNPAPGLVATGPSDDAFILHRVLIHANVRAGDHLRAFVEVEDAREAGRSPGPVATDVNRDDVGQAFLEITDTGGAIGMGARLGRQEMAFGSRRLVGLREGANIRQRFDGVRGWLQRGAARIDLFAVRPTIHRPGGLDDRADPASTFSGAHATLQLAPEGRAALDVYAYRSTNDRVTLDAGSARERRQTAGLRWSGANGRWTYDLEGAYQWGRFGERRIASYAAFADASFVVVPGPSKPSLGLKAHRSSGGSDRDTVRTFNPLFSRVALINEANLQTYSNLTSLYPYVSVRPTPKLALTGGVDLQWRTSRADGFYAPPLRTLVPGAANGRARLGDAYNLQLDLTANANLSFTAAVVRYDVRGFLKDAGARDTTWLGAWSTFRF